MKVLLLANQPESTTRLKMFQSTLENLDYDVAVPKFSSKNWLTISSEAKKIIKQERPDTVHLFNVPDIIYRNIPELRGKYFKKLIYDYRSPWGLEYSLVFGRLAGAICEHYERKLAKEADALITVNSPLREKLQSYLNDVDLRENPVTVIPNYPSSNFIRTLQHREEPVSLPDDFFALFVGRIDKHEGVYNLLKLIKALPDIHFLIVGSGPFSRLYFWKHYPNAVLTGWQPHSLIPCYIKKARLCIIPFSENVVSPYITEKGVWKLNEYLNLGKRVIASGISQEEPRKNLTICHSKDLARSIRAHFDNTPEPLESFDYRFWEMNHTKIREVYESLL
ncbi:MAG TPA: glycosyltransferase [Methanolinea sp.]|nr:glycosyltransferase [Methanolinea sp.]HQI25179.1 glycosyltransferase [Smithella sp.]